MPGLPSFPASFLAPCAQQSVRVSFQFPGDHGGTQSPGEGVRDCCYSGDILLLLLLCTLQGKEGVWSVT